MDPELSFSTPKVTQVTSNSITFTWDWKITGLSKDRVHFQVTARGEFPDGGYYKRIDAPDGNACTFPDLKDDTEYSFCIIAFDDEDQELGQYPDYDAEVTLTVKTKVLDEDAPTVSSRELKVSAPNPEGFTVTWTRAKDKVTAAKNILYEFWLKEIGGAQDAKLFKKGKYLSSAKVTGLKTATKYEFYVLAIDEAGNSLRYPSDDGVGTAETVDNVAPSVVNDIITVTGYTQDSISIQWRPATDNVTEQAKIRYEIWWTRADNSKDTWHSAIAGTGVSSYRISDLRDSTPYNIFVKAIDRAGNELKYQPVSKTTQDKTAPQTDSKSVTVVDTTIDSISLRWNLAQDNTTAKEKIKYEIWWKRNDSADTWHSATAGAGISSYIIRGLKEGTQYAYYIRAIDEAGNQAKFLDNGGYFYASTKDKTAPKVDSKSVTVMETTNNSISLKWNQATDNVTEQAKIRYEVWWTRADDSQDPWHSAMAGTGVSSYKITGLKEGSKYAFYIKAIDEAGNQKQFLDDGNYFRASTKDKTAPEADPQSITVTETGSNSISIKWNQATDNVSAQANIRYEVWWTRNNDQQDPWHSATAGTGVSSFKITGLREVTLYSIYVKAIDESGNSFKYNSQLATTKSSDSSAPTTGDRKIQVTYRDLNTISVQWNPATDNKTAKERIVYQLYFYREEDPNWRLVKEATNFYSYTFSDLKEGTDYSCLVKAIDEAGNVLQYPGAGQSWGIKTTTKQTWKLDGPVNCNGIRKNTPDVYLITHSTLNRKKFTISFCFQIEPNSTSEKIGTEHPILIFDTSKYTLRLYWKRTVHFSSIRKGTHQVYLSINNGQKVFNTGIFTTARQWQVVALKYNKGKISINGKILETGELDSITGGNNRLSSQDDARGACFKGIIRDLKVISY